MHGNISKSMYYGYKTHLILYFHEYIKFVGIYQAFSKKFALEDSFVHCLSTLFHQTLIARTWYLGPR